MEIKDIIAKNITCLRKRENMTQADLANKLNYSDKAISKWERGESLPDAEMLYKISKLFNVDIQYLFNDHEYAGLTNDEIKNLKKREIEVKVIFALSVIFIITTLAGILFASISEIYHISEYVKWYLFIIPAIPAIALIFDFITGKKKFNLVFESLFIWSAAIAFYIFFIDYNLVIIFSIAAIIQAALILFPKILSFFVRKPEKPKKIYKDKSKDKENSGSQNKPSDI